MHSNDMASDKIGLIISSESQPSYPFRNSFTAGIHIIRKKK